MAIKNGHIDIVNYLYENGCFLTKEHLENLWRTSTLYEKEKMNSIRKCIKFEI